MFVSENMFSHQQVLCLARGGRQLVQGKKGERERGKEQAGRDPQTEVEQAGRHSFPMPCMAILGLNPAGPFLYSVLLHG